MIVIENRPKCLQWFTEYMLFFSISVILLEVLLYECPHKAFWLTTKKKFTGKIIGASWVKSL